jgi:membrane protease YdiL (CAAX protease family)
VTRWAAFAGVTAFVLVALLLLARASQSVVEPTARDPRLEALPDGAEHLDALDAPGTPVLGAAPLGTVTLLVNVTLSQGVFAALLLAGAWLTEVPPSAFGVSAATVGPGIVALGVGVGGALYLANELGSRVATALGVGPGEELRALLAPDSPREWALLLLVVLPAIAGFEELLFRGALVGALSVGFGVSPWLLAVGSSLAFGVAHGAQGPAGVLVTGLLGFALAATFVLTGSLLVVVVAHYLVNALEFVVHEGLGVG